MDASIEVCCILHTGNGLHPKFFQLSERNLCLMFVMLAFRPELIGFKTRANLTEHEVGTGRRKR